MTTSFPYADSSFFAVQIKRAETPHDAACSFLRTAGDGGVPFKRLDFLDTFSVGSTSFARLRADLINPWPTLDKLLAAKRSVVGPGGSDEAPHGYLVRLVNGKTGSVPFSTMHAVARAPRTYRGTALEHWRRQLGG